MLLNLQVPHITAAGDTATYRGPHVQVFTLDGPQLPDVETGLGWTDRRQRNVDRWDAGPENETRDCVDFGNRRSGSTVTLADE